MKYRKSALLEGRVSSYMVADGKLRACKIGARNWHKKLSSKGKTPFKSAECELILVYNFEAFRFEGTELKDRDKVAGRVNSVIRLTFCTDEQGYTATEIGDIDVSTLSWSDFKKVMSLFFNKSDYMLFTLDFARKHAPLTRKMAWCDFELLPDGKDVKSLGNYQGYVNKLQYLSEQEKSSKAAMTHGSYNDRLRRHYVQAVKDILYELREVTDSKRRDGSSKYFMASKFNLNGHQYHKGYIESDRILALTYYLDGVFALWTRELLSGHDLNAHEKSLLKNFNRYAKGQEYGKFGKQLKGKVLQKNAHSLSLVVDSRGHHPLLVFADKSYAVRGFCR